jgi:hypothetical protein
VSFLERYAWTAAYLAVVLLALLIVGAVWHGDSTAIVVLSFGAALLGGAVGGLVARLH